MRRRALERSMNKILTAIINTVLNVYDLTMVVISVAVIVCMLFMAWIRGEE